MTSYVLRRLGQSLFLLVAISVLVYALFTALPGDYYSSNRTLTPERVAELRALAGLDQPPVMRYFVWLGNLLHGDLGYSLQFDLPTAQLLGPYLWHSFIVALAALVLTWTIALVVGVMSATRHHSLLDRLVTLGVFVSMSFPSFFIGLLMIQVFALQLQWLPPGGMIDTGSRETGLAHVLEVARHMILPVAILTILSIGSLTRYFRSGMLDVLRADFIRTARAKGLKERTVVLRHALRNALLPAITLLAFELPGLFAGAIITEQIFDWPGVGRLQLEAVSSRDYGVLMTITMLLAALTVVGNFAADVMYAAADPRIRLTGRDGRR